MLIAAPLGAVGALDMLNGLLAQAAGPSNPLVAYAPFILIPLIIYFLFIRPQSRQAKEHKAMLASLKKGDGVVTSGGLIGKVHSVADKFLLVEVAPSVRLRIVKSSISGKVANGLLDEEPKSETKDKLEEKK